MYDVSEDNYLLIHNSYVVKDEEEGDRVFQNEIRSYIPCSRERVSVYQWRREEEVKEPLGFCA